MNSKSNQVLIGIILLLVGLYTFGQSILKINYGNILMVVAGFAFLLLYRTKRKNWSLVIGTYLTYLGLLATNTGGTRYMDSMFVAMFFMAPGIIFLVLFFDKNKRGLLFPGSFLFWFGLFTILKDIPIFSGLSNMLLFMCFAMAFFMIFRLGRYFVGKWSLYGGIFCMFFSISALLRISPNIAYLRYLPQLGSLTLICISIFIIIRALVKR